MADLLDSAETRDPVEELPEYLKEVNDTKFLNISIKGYEKKSSTSGFTKEEYYAYKVVSIMTPEGTVPEEPNLLIPEETGKNRNEVWRRYSEFEVLKNFLSVAYPFIIIPPLPEKAIKGTSGLLSKITFSSEDHDFLQKRQQALELFLVRISRHPILCRNYWFHQFMLMIGWRDGVTKTGYASKSETLLQYITHTLSKLKPDQRFLAARNYADELERSFRTFLEIRIKLVASLKAVYKLHANYGRVFSEWSEMEEKLATALQIHGGCMDSLADSVDVYIDEDDVRFLLPLKEYIAYCDALRTMVRRQEMLQKHVERCEENLSNKSDAKEALAKENPETGGSGGSRFSLKAISTRLKGGDTSYFGRMSQATQELQEAEDQTKKAQKDLEAFTRDGIHELERFNSQKNSDFRSILINYVQLQMHIHKKGANTWERVRAAYED